MYCVIVVDKVMCSVLIANTVSVVAEVTILLIILFICTTEVSTARTVVFLCSMLILVVALVLVGCTTIVLVISIDLTTLVGCFLGASWIRPSFQV